MRQQTKRLLLSAICFVCVTGFFLSRTNVSVLDPVRKAAWQDEQKQRLDDIDDACSAIGEGRRTPQDLAVRDVPVKRLIYNDEHKIIYCHLPKIASTNWKRIFTVLNGHVNTTQPLDITHEFVHRTDYTRSLTLKSLPVEERARRLATYKKFLFVRHPFERLLSAYNDKLRDNSTNSIENFQKLYGKRILRRYRPHAPKEVIDRGGDVTFPEFVRYLTDPSVRDRLAEPHWAPMSELCRPCEMKYDYVGKYDTLLNDVDMILKDNNVELPFSFPPKDNANSATKKMLYSHMKQLSDEQFQLLYRTYQRDFELFGYDHMDWGPH